MLLNLSRLGRLGRSGRGGRGSLGLVRIQLCVEQGLLLLLLLLLRQLGSRLALGLGFLRALLQFNRKSAPSHRVGARGALARRQRGGGTLSLGSSDLAQYDSMSLASASGSAGARDCRGDFDLPPLGARSPASARA